ncbi:MAG TPA: hypothetical protein VGM88_34360 [Kofleriaceae bacterium]|jgi:hypothetical protein
MKLVGERRALASAIFFLFALLYILLSFLGDPSFGRALMAVGGVYGLAFFALVAGYFWARWYAVGVGLYGVISTVIGVYQVGAEPILLVMGGAHAAAALLLWGDAMSQPYDGQTAWRERFHMDDSAVQRLGRSVIRAGISLPVLAFLAFMPKQGSAVEVVSIGALLLGLVGFRSLVKLRTVGLLALGGAGVMLLALAGFEIGHGAAPAQALYTALAGGLFAAAAAPFAAPAFCFLRSGATLRTR